MRYRTTTSYGTWCNIINPSSTSPDADLLDSIAGADAEWRELVEETGALDEMQLAYYRAIDAALPPSVSLCGDEFIGPVEVDEGEFDAYPTDEFGDLDIKAIVERIDIEAIVEYHNPITLEDIGRNELQSKAQRPERTASVVMGRLGVQPFAHVPHPESKRTINLYLAGDVREALAKRPGRGARTARPAGEGEHA